MDKEIIQSYFIQEYWFR